jgi:hypothetical protein
MSPHRRDHRVEGRVADAGGAARRAGGVGVGLVVDQDELRPDDDLPVT